MSVYACSDLHGMYDLWKQVQDFLKEDDTLYFLGDAADRGPDGYRIITELLADERVLYLKGNHEQFLVEGMANYLDYHEIYYLWISGNGGLSTFESIKEKDEPIIRSLIAQINNLPLHYTYKNKDGLTIHLSHAGYNPNENISERKLLWDRVHFVKPWPKDKQYQDVYIVHGHTPTPFLRQDLKEADMSYINNDGAIFYSDGHKIDIDCGAFATKATVLLDLDTFETFPFQTANTNRDQNNLLYGEW